MTAPETGPEIPADPMAKIRREVDHVNEQSADQYDEWMAERGCTTSRAHWKKRALAAEARLASLEAERAKTVEPDREVLAILDDNDGYPRWAVVGFPIGAVRKLCGWSEWQYARREALASEKGGPA